jgi:hypothetical protein
MTDTTPAEPLRIPIGRNVTYAVRGMPPVANAYGPGFLVPTEVSLTYRAAEDSQLGRFHAYVKGQWLRDGEVVPSGEKLPGQHYNGDPANWPEWLAEEARLHDPDAAASAPVSPAPAELAKHVTRAIFALKTPSPDGSKHYQSGWDDGLEAAMDAARDAVLAVLPEPADRPAILREAADRIDETRAPFPIAVQNGITWATAELRRHAAECPQCGSTGACNGGPCPLLRRLAAAASGPGGVAGETGQDAVQAVASCPYGEGPGDGSGCIKPAGHDGEHVVTPGVQVMPCAQAVLRQPHSPHAWWPQPGMAYVHCPGPTPAA